jgi:L-fucose dehydrogenase
MGLRFQDKVVLITGGAAGIGRGCAEVFFQEGGRIAVVDRDRSAAETVVAQFNEERANAALFIPCDVANSEAMSAAVAATVEHFGRLDCLICNAGIHPPDTPIESTSDDDLSEVMQINFVSTFVGCRQAMPHLRKHRGSIVIMSSMTAVLGQKNSCAYSASKGAQLSLTRSLALEGANDGVRVNAVLPGNVDTPLMRRWAATLPDPQAALARIADLQPLKRMATAQEVGRVCLFLASNDASFVTGQGIEVDGGASLDY